MFEASSLPSRFVVRRVLGEGGVCTVLAAFDAALEREVAVKILPDSLLRDETTRARFLREARSAASLRHPNIVTVHDVDADRGFLLMELVSGESLDVKLKRSGKLSIDEVRAIGVQLCAALGAAHDVGLVHRDVKPANILIDETGTVKLADFGVVLFHDSDITRPGAFVGTPAYIAPEQLRGRNVDGRADIYSAGVTLFHAVTGLRLHTPEGPLADPRRVLLESGADPELTAAIMRAIEEKPEQRFQTAAELADALAPARDARRSRPRPRAVYFALASLVMIAGSEPSSSSRVVKVALLPFIHEAHATELDFAEAGLPHLLGTELRNVGGIRSIGYYKLLGHVGRQDASRETWMKVAQELGAGVAVYGEVIAAGDRVRVVINVAEPSGLLLARFERVVDARAVPETLRRLAPDIATVALGEHVVIERGAPVVFDQERRLLRGVVALEQHRVDEALAELEAALAFDPSSAEVHYYLAVASWWMNRPIETTLSHVEAALKGRIDEPRRRFLEGLRFLVAYQFPSSIDWFESAAAAFPDDRDLLYGLFESLYHGGYPAKAMVVYRRLAELYPDFRLGMMHAISFHLVHADESGMDQLLERISRQGDLVHTPWLARVLVAKREHAKAIELLDGLISERAADPWLHLALVDTYATSGQLELAEAHQLQAIERDPISGMTSMLALAIARGSATDEALWRDRLMEELAKVERVALDVWITLALIEVPRGDRGRLEWIRRSIESAPMRERSGDLRYHMTRALLAGAMQERGLLELGAKSGFPEVAAAARAFLAELAGDHAAAAEQWKRAVKSSADGRFIIVEQFQLAKALAAIGDRAGVIRACAEVIEPRLMQWAWAATVGPCRAMSAEATGHGRN